MKVLLVHDKGPAAGAHDSTALGGNGLYLASLAAELPAPRVQVAQLRFTPSPAADLPPHYEMRGSCWRLRPGILDRIDAILARERPDLIHIHSSTYDLHPRMLDRLARLPLLVTLHDVTLFCFRHTRLERSGRPCCEQVGWGCLARGCHRPGSMMAPLQDFARVALHSRILGAFRRLPAFAVPSGYIRAVMIGHGFAADRIEVHPPFVRFPPRALPEPANPGLAPLILFAGRLTREKGAHLLADALTRLPRGLAWRARFAGSGPLEAELRATLAAAGLAGRVDFPGAVPPDRMPGLFADAAIFVFPSLAAESLGLAGLEAMAFGRPVVAFPSGGVAEWLEHGRTGLFAPHGDSAALAAAIARLLADPPLRRRLGEQAALAVAARFTPRRHLDRLLALYRRLAAAPAKAPARAVA